MTTGTTGWTIATTRGALDHGGRHDQRSLWMYSVIGLLSRPDDVPIDEWRAWWTERHVPKVLALPGLIDYVIWPIDEELDQRDQTFGEPSYAGVAIITFESKQAFLDAIETPEGHADLDSFNSSAPRSLVLCGQPLVQRNGLR